MTDVSLNCKGYIAILGTIQLSLMFTNHIDLKDINKPDLALNNLQWLICHKTQPNLTKQVSIDLRVNGNEEVLYTHQSFKTEASLLNGV